MRTFNCEDDVISRKRNAKGMRLRAKNKTKRLLEEEQLMIKPSWRSRKHLPDYKVNPVKVESRDAETSWQRAFFPSLVLLRKKESLWFDTGGQIKERKRRPDAWFVMAGSPEQHVFEIFVPLAVCLTTLSTCAVKELHTCVDDDRTRTLREKSCSLDYLSNIVLSKQLRCF